MPALTVLVAPEGPLEGIRDVLHDLSALGLVAPFVWCPAADITESDAGAVEVDDGDLRRTTLRRALMARDIDRVRVCVLVPVLEGAAPMAAVIEERVADLVRVTVAGAALERVRCVVARPGAEVDPGALAREGWHNVLVAPEESPGPERGHALLSPSADAADVGRHAAPVIAAVLGLWSTLDDAPLDGQQPLPGPSVRLVRSFYRGLSAAAVEAQLRAEVLGVRDGLPLVRHHGTSAAYVEDVQLATSTMARALWARHEDVLTGPRVRPSAEAPSHFGPMDAIRMLLGFVAAALRNAPGRWYAGVLNRTASGVAGRVQAYVFGTAPSAYEVVVKGLTASGLPVGWEDEVEAASRLEDALAAMAPSRAHEAPPQLGALWQDYATAALTLADAGERSAAFPPVQVGALRGVLRRPEDCVPGQEHDFRDLSGFLAATVELDGVGAADVLGARTLQRRLDILAGADATALEAERARQALHTWQAERGRSFAVQVGGVLGRRIVEVGAEIRAHLRTIESLAVTHTPGDAAAARQKRLARWIRAILFVALFVVAGAVGLVLGNVVALAIGLAIIAGTVLGWFVATLTVFLQQQRTLFQELHRRRVAVSQLEATQANLGHALRDQRRLGLAYRQFLSWSAILGRFLAEPNGAPPAQPGDDAPAVVGLPLSCRLGSAVVDPAALNGATVALRRAIFAAGWLEERFAATIRAAAQRLGAEAEDLQTDPDSAFRLPAWPEPTILTLLRDQLTADGVDDAIGQDLWSSAITALDSTSTALREALVAAVRPCDGGRAVDADEFWAGVADPLRSGGHRFDRAHLTRVAQASGAGDVDLRHHRAFRRGLGTTAVVTELSGGIPVYYLAAGAGAEVQEPADTDQPRASGQDTAAIPLRDEDVF